MTSFKVLLLLPPCVVTAAVAFKLSSPAIVDISVSDLPLMFDGFGSWLFTPWYMFLVINSIIAAIFACSRLFSAESPPLHHSRRLTPPSESIPMYYPAAEFANDCNSIVEPKTNFVPYEKSNCRKNEPASFHPNADSGGSSGFTDDATSNKENECSLIAKSSSLKSPIMKTVIPVTAPQFGHKRNSKSSPQGGKPVLGLSKPTMQDTQEGSAMPQTRHMNKPETWEKTPPKTNNNARSPSSGGRLNDSAGIRDELNRRVEAFIRKFNEDMRLQR